MVSSEVIMKINRRTAIAGVACSIFPSRAVAPSATNSLIDSIERVVVEVPKVPGGTWFHPRACLVGKKVLMTLQTIKGSDFFGPVHWMESGDYGIRWGEVKPVPSLGWVPVESGGYEGVCDVTPEYHAPTRSVLALGHNVFYSGERFDSHQPPRWPIYSVWKDGQWGPREKLVWDDPRGSYIYSNNCGQRVVMPNGDVVMSFTFGVKDKPRSVCGVRCAFDGRKLMVKKVGNALTNEVGRGLLEPSVTRFESRFYLTIRAEDKRGYVAVSRDGVYYQPQQPWAWDDGTPLEMSTTQQHWLAHSKALFLVYTRKDPSNVNVPRWRAPLWISEVDTKSLKLRRSTERILLPLVGNGVNRAESVPMMGNFGVAHISAGESWVTDGSWCPKAGNSGELQIARVRWRLPNRMF
jgi:hypothetical protein